MTPKFKTGFRVSILPRVNKNLGHWENSSIGCDAIINASNLDEDYGYEQPTNEYDKSAACYDIIILEKDGTMYGLRWFEENALELICTNDEKGKKIIDAFNRGIRNYDRA